jgi:hypothetical protein
MQFQFKRHFAIILSIIVVSCIGSANNEFLSVKESPSKPQNAVNVNQPSEFLKNANQLTFSSLILVRFRDETNNVQILRIKDELRLEFVKIITKPYLYLIRIPKDTSVNEIIERLRSYDEVLYAEPDYTRKLYD